ncbi:DUF397 domain-containing protein [Kitasatospora sp. NBC_00240]|uniref:DUF397 domain-containing protein n=1 Tax=Kitasatospora sp. NBC_00240 TaxID=2903567 RepID=UPI0022507B3B|nr:DUF397 domain-containing protein [Kitasatospora sp. NBC_00240]MCX5211905.1 DUF397 domain-containing protein [Kitasatospora sp. NBC_00240]
MSNWQKSSYSGNANECVEVRHVDGLVEVRESDNGDVVIRTTPQKWAKFLLGARDGEFDRYGDFSA